MDHNGYLNTSFLPDIRSLSLVVTDAIQVERLSIVRCHYHCQKFRDSLFENWLQEVLYSGFAHQYLLDENCAFQLHNIKQNNERPKIRFMERRG